MKNFSIAALGIALASPMAAYAGGPAMPVAEPMVAAPVVMAAPVTADWTGFYTGAALGYGDVGSTGGVLDGTGTLGGVFAGYRRDFGTLIVGAELDYDWAQIDLGAGADTLDDVYRFKLQAGGEVGNAFLYATAGMAWADATVGGTSLNSDGWLAGAGLDYAINTNWVAGGEVLWHQFNDFAGTGIDFDATTIKLRVAYKF